MVEIKKKRKKMIGSFGDAEMMLSFVESECLERNLRPENIKRVAKDSSGKFRLLEIESSPINEGSKEDRVNQVLILYF
jgi:hypothetical protein